jgi:DNA repair exonuclease SbcCD ATPase subunit
MPGPSSSANSPSQHHHDAAADAAAATKIEATAVIASANAARERVQRLQRYRENLAATVDRKERALSASTGVLRKERERKQLQERRARLAELDDLRRRLHNEVEQAVAAVRGDHDRVLRHRRRQLETGTTGTQQTKALADARIMCVRVENQLAADQAVLQEVRTALASAQTAIASKDSELRQLQAALRAKQQELRVATEINERERQRAADDQARTFREKTEIVARLVGDETAVLRQVDAVRAERQKLEQQLRAAEASSAAAAADASRLREAAAALEADAARQRAAADAAAGAAVDAAKQRQKAATDRLAAARKAAAAVEARDAEIQRLTQAVEKAKRDAAARNTDEMALLERLDRIERLLALST